MEKAFAVRDALERRGASLGLEGLDLERRRLKAALEASERRRREAEEARWRSSFNRVRAHHAQR